MTEQEHTPTPARPLSIVACYTHHSRRDELAQTMAAFDAIGLPIDHVQVQTDEPRPAHNRRNAWTALKHCAQLLAPRRDPIPPGVLLIEDDITPARTLPEWLAVIEAQEHTTTLYLPNGVTRYTPDRLEPVAAGRRKARRSELVPIPPEQLRGWWGAQAVWVPMPLVQRIVRDQRMQAFEHAIGPWDHALRLTLREQDATLLVAIPNVVQHRQPPNVIIPTKRRHASLVYSETAPAPKPTKVAAPATQEEREHATG